MKRWFCTRWVLVLGLSLAPAPAGAQIVERERDVKITGPRGRSIERSIVSERGPGFVDRQVTIQRPGGTFHSNALIERAPAPSVVRGGGFAPPGRFPRWGPRPFVGREVIINNGGGGWLAPLAIGLGSFGVGMFAGSALASQPAPPPAPQPVYAVPPGYVLQPAPAVVYPAQPAYAPAQPVQAAPPPPGVDPVADAAARLQSHHANSRRDGAYTLGRLRDPRAIPALVDRLKNDNDSDVRVAAATALGEIGDPRAAIYLERVTIYDKKQKVRDAAALALTRLPRESANPVVTSTPAPTNAMPAPALPSTGTPPASPIEPEPIERVPPPPTPAPATTTAGPGFPQNP
jgi:hypothetical protein